MKVAIKMEDPQSDDAAIAYPNARILDLGVSGYASMLCPVLAQFSVRVLRMTVRIQAQMSNYRKMAYFAVRTFRTAKFLCQ